MPGATTTRAGRNSPAFRTKAGTSRGENGTRVDLVLVPERQVADVRPIIYSKITAHAAGRQSDHVPVGLQLALPLG